MFAALAMAYPAASAAHDCWSGLVDTPASWLSTVLPISFGLSGLVWVLAMGAIIRLVARITVDSRLETADVSGNAGGTHEPR